MRTLLSRLFVLVTVWTPVSLPAAAQILTATLHTGTQDGGLWHIDIASGDRTLLATEDASAIAVDDAGGRILIANGAVLRQWTYGSSQTAATTLGTIRRTNGSALDVSGLAFGAGRLFAATHVGSSLFEVSLATLIATPVSPSFPYSSVEGLSFDPSSSLFYVSLEVGPYPHATDVYAIDLLNAGAPSFVAHSLPGVAQNACVGNGVAYMVKPYSRFIDRIDLASGVITPMVLSTPWRSGWDECGAEFAPGLVLPPGPRVFCHPTPTACSLSLYPLGTPSASAGSGFLVQHQSLPQRSRLHPHYSFSGRSTLPFLSGYRCLRPPVFRLAPSIVPAATGCVVSFGLDFNAVIAQGAHPSLLAGQTVWYQAWVDAPPLYGNSFGVTAGLEFTIQP